MKVNMSAYLNGKKAIVKALVEELSKDFAYVSVLGSDTVGKRYGLKRTGVELNDSMWCERGFVARVYNGINYSEYSFNLINEENFESVISRIKETGLLVNKLMKEVDIAITDYKVIEEETINQHFEAEVKVLPEQLSHEEKLDKMRQIMNKTLAFSQEFVDVRVMYEEVHISKIFISTNKDLSQSYIWTNGGVIPIGVRDDQMKYAIGVASGRKGAEVLSALEGVYEQTAKNVLMLLGSKTIKPGEYDVILDPDMAGLVAHEAFGHGVEMDMFVKNRAKAAEYMDKRVASNHVDMYDGALSAIEVSSYLFDDEGVLGTDTKIIDQGILKRGISDVLSALTLGTKPTGNGKRQNYEHKAYARMTNTFFGSGEDTLEEMIASMDYGFLLESYSSGMEDPKNWGIQCVVSRGREIKEGQFTGNVFSPIFLTGYVPDLLESMTMVSKEVVVTGNGYCGKGHKEFVKTSTGGPFIKARGRLN